LIINKIKLHDLKYLKEILKSSIIVSKLILVANSLSIETDMLSARKAVFILFLNLFLIIFIVEKELLVVAGRVKIRRSGLSMKK
jgi:hypothetical protein